MKIKLNTNDHNIELPDQFSNVKVEYGYTFYDKTLMTEKDSFVIKLISRLDKIVKTKKSNAKKVIVESVLYASNYIESIIKKETLENISIQFNVNTFGVKTVKKLLNPFLFVDDDLYDALESDRVLANYATNVIKLGENNLRGLSDGFVKLLVNKYGIKDASETMFFHELSHLLERENKLDNLYTKEHEYINTKIDMAFNRKAYEINNWIINNAKESNESDYFLLHARLLGSFKVLRGEMYADTSSLLLKRNYQISKDEYDFNNFTSYIKDVSLFRNMEFDEYLKNLGGHTDLTPTHLTAPATDELEKIIKDLGMQQLNEKEINNITQDIIKKGMYKYIYVFINSSEVNKQQIKILFNTRYNSKTGDAYIPEHFDENDNLHYDNLINLIEESLELNWKKDFDNKVKKIKNFELNDLSESRLILRVGTNINLNPEIEEYLNNIIVDTKSELVSNKFIKIKDSVCESMKTLRFKFNNTDKSENTIGIKTK